MAERQGAVLREAISVADITFKLDSGFEIVGGVSLSVAEDSIVAIVGPSGCGKTTLLRVLCGLLKPTTGTVIWGGTNMGVPSRHCILLDQELILFPWMKCIEHVKFGLQRPLREDWNVGAMGILSTVGLGSSALRYPHELSGGMKQRLALARAMAAHPAVLLLDEPFSALDVNSRMEIEDLLCSVINTTHKTAALLVTHDVRDAVYVADRILVITPRPARIARMFHVPFGRPRRADMRQDEEFIRLQAQIEREIVRGV
jgi:ABC-type nitrate/sulfonate/bicarbonate transport system ATPase subunit